MKLSKKEFLDLIEANQGLIHKVCHSYCDHEEDHKDLFQEIMLQLWQSFPKFQKKAKTTTWMYRVALYTAISRLKKNKVEKQKREKFEPATDYDPVEETHKLDDLRYAIQGLSDIERAVTTLYLDEKSYQEIAEILGISESNVGVRINRVKKKLRQKLISNEVR